MNDWIKCSERLPPDDYHVLVSDGHNFYTAKQFMGSWHCVCNCSDGSSVDNAIHWMELPPDPKK